MLFQNQSTSDEIDILIIYLSAIKNNSFFMLYQA